jgi:hypothetical protein
MCELITTLRRASRVPAHRLIQLKPLIIDRSPMRIFNDARQTELLPSFLRVQRLLATARSVMGLGRCDSY